MKPINQIESELLEKLSDKTLSFGCRGIAEFTHDGKNLDDYWIYTQTSGWIECDKNWNLKNGWSALKPNKIIGHPVTLARVLFMTEMPESYGLPAMPFRSDVLDESKWDCSKDDLTLQSEEVLRYLHGIFCN